MIKYIVGIYSKVGEVSPFNENDIVISDRSLNDTRIGWKDSRNVCTRRFYTERYPVPQCIGMCATKYKKRKAR